jgi:aspartate/methionine/tyrosine aminotransferase
VPGSTGLPALGDSVASNITGNREELMRIETFEMERMQSTWENVVDYDLSESGVYPVTLRELVDMGLDLDWALDTPLSYSQSNGTPELREALCQIYPGATPDQIEVTNGTSEANYLLALSQLRPGDDFGLQIPNYMQLWGVPRSLGAAIRKFRLRPDDHWQPDWDEFEAAVHPGTRMVYVSNPNNPTGSVLSRPSMQRIVDRCEEVGAWLISDEVYLGAEIEGERTPSFWGLSDRVLITSGLSKAYGIPGVRIGWVVGPGAIVRECWTQHDSLTISPSKLSDAMARIAVEPGNRARLYARGRDLLRNNLEIMRRWVARLGEGFEFIEPVAGAMCFIKYPGTVGSVELSERVRDHQSTLIVPGAHLGMEGYVRIWMGGQPEYLRAGLERIEKEFRQVLNLPA